MNINSSLCICQPFATVNTLGAKVDSIKLSFPEFSDPKITQLSILVSSENTQNKWVEVIVENIHQIENNQFLVSFQKDIFDKKTNLFFFEQRAFTQLLCSVNFRITPTINEGMQEFLIEHHQVRVLPTICDELERFEHLKFDDMSYSLSKPMFDDKKHPLVICLHGAGEGGHNQSNILADKLAVTFLENEHQSLFDEPYILAPQCPSFWLDKFELNSHLYYGERDYTDSLIKLITHILGEYQYIDSKRIYIIGSSMGGYQGLRLIAHAPNLFSAAIISCPAKIPAAQQLDKIKIPIWFVHSKLDKTVPILNTYTIMDHIKNINPYIKTTYLSNITIQNQEIDPHCVFLYVYDNKIHDGNISIFQWLTTQHKE